ncbi:zinc ribbon domain-containing protein [Candidatus Micrarchaeota archaeon]|nr:zinc ribbon domain-containing protein [Candidatus Micrarchaeota archaeon]
MSNICQSCGMPMQKDSDFGTNDDKGKSEEYCEFCFQNGKFTDEGISMEEKIEKNVKIAMEMGFAEAKAREMAENTIPTLKRWKKQ